MAKQIVGVVSSTKGDKTIVVTVQTRKTHPLYRKQYTVHSKFMAHDAKNEAEVGDKVAIVETKPLSARKRHTLDRIIEKPKLREDTLSISKSEDTGNAAMMSAKPAKLAKEETVEETEVVKSKAAKSEESK